MKRATRPSTIKKDLGRQSTRRQSETALSNSACRGVTAPWFEQPGGGVQYRLKKQRNVS
ncbi:MAG: glycohydrolase toxin TNT-related protein [Thermoguttaceae bacterium]|nr:glycohydrolase toxin TNT-related protein [Thermoguttaceae bacterium]